MSQLFCKVTEQEGLEVTNFFFFHCLDYSICYKTIFCERFGRSISSYLRQVLTLEIVRINFLCFQTFDHKRNLCSFCTSHCDKVVLIEVHCHSLYLPDSFNIKVEKTFPFGVFFFFPRVTTVKVHTKKWSLLDDNDKYEFDFPGR